MNDPAPLDRSPLADLLGNANTRNGLTFEDRTLGSRAGIKGPGARDFLVSRGFGPLPPPNHSVRTSSGTVVAMLGKDEALILDSESSASLWSFQTGAAQAPGAYPVPRREGSFWITVAGTGTPAMFAMVCGVDLRPKAFADLAIAQTMVAKTTAIIIRDTNVGVEGFHVVADISLGSYLVSQLLDAADSL